MLNHTRGWRLAKVRSPASTAFFSLPPCGGGSGWGVRHKLMRRGAQEFCSSHRPSEKAAVAVELPLKAKDVMQ